jgi:hypothetical protein
MPGDGRASRDTKLPRIDRDVFEDARRGREVDLGCGGRDLA